MNPARTAALAIAAVLTSLVTPVVTLPTAHAVPVRPDVTHLPLVGVDRTAPADPGAPDPDDLDAADAIGSPAPASGAVFDDTPEVITPELDTDPFVLVGATWSTETPSDGIVVQVRVRESGVWTGWEALEAMDESPENGSAEYADEDRRLGTSPLLTQGADGVQARVDVPAGTAVPGDLRLDLVDPGASAADADLQGNLPAATADSAAPRPPIISRASWGADESLRSGSPSYSSTIKVGIVHHTASTNNYAAADAAAQVRAIYAYHTRSNGWSDIGYNFLVDKFGRIYEGRAGGIDRPVVGAHAGGFNTDTFGVSALGDYQAAGAPAAMVESIAQVMAWKLTLTQRNPRGTATLVSAGGGTARYPAGTPVTVNVISGHRDVGQTACPGINLYSQLAAIRSRAAAWTGSALTDPWYTVQPRRPGDNGAVFIRSGLLNPGLWQVDVRNSSGAVVRSLGGSGSSISTAWDFRDGAGGFVPDDVYTFAVFSNQAGAGSVAWTFSVRSAEARGNAEVVQATPSGAVRVAGWALGTSTAAPATVRMTVDGVEVARGQAALARPDVAGLYPGYGAGHGFDITAPSAPGSRRVCAEVVMAGALGTPSLGCATVSVAAANQDTPTGQLTSVAGVPGGVAVSGWAGDRQAADGMEVHVYVDGVGAGAYRASARRADGTWAFSASIPLLPGATRSVCAFAINVGAGAGNTALGCASAAVPSGNPSGNLEGVRPVPGGVRVSGWALDPDSPAPVGVHVYVDGAFAGSAAAGGSRPDVAAVYPLLGAGRGFSLDVPAAAGSRLVCVFAINAGAGTSNPLLGCARPVVASGNPVGTWDGVAGGRGTISVSGWALDPDSASSVPVHVYVDGTFRGAFAADVARPDVAAAFPDHGARHGYLVTVPGLSPGRHTACVFAINVGPGSANPLLGCPSAVTT